MAKRQTTSSVQVGRVRKTYLLTVHRNAQCVSAAVRQSSMAVRTGQFADSLLDWMPRSYPFTPIGMRHKSHGGHYPCRPSPPSALRGRRASPIAGCCWHPGIPPVPCGHSRFAASTPPAATRQDDQVSHSRRPAGLVAPRARWPTDNPCRVPQCLTARSPHWRKQTGRERGRLTPLSANEG